MRSQGVGNRLLVALVLPLLAWPTSGRAEALRVDIAPQPLSSALLSLARQAHVDILFAETTIGDRRAQSLRGRMSFETALERLLANSGLRFRKTHDGAYAVNLAPPPPPEPDVMVTAAMPEILVIGRRTQNSDIRRTQNDIQPHQVFSRRDVEDAHGDTLDTFARTRVTSNTSIISPAQDTLTQAGSTRSEIDLRGMGPDQTLILVDGRRMPHFPRTIYTLGQPDVNGIPPSMIERIEVVTGTAGGIYGTGATAGAINLILKRDYRGVEGIVTSGITDRGDGQYLRLDARLGFTPDHGRTDVMLAISRVRSQTLRTSQRDYYSEARKTREANGQTSFYSEYPIGSGINIFGFGSLTLDPEFGGAALGSSVTMIPLGNFDPAQRAALFLANAGHIDIAVPSGKDGKRGSITNRPDMTSVFFNARHRFGGGIEAFVDLMWMRNEGEAVTRGIRSTDLTLPANSPNNPFQQPIVLAMTFPDFASNTRNRVTTLRYTAGVVAPLFGNWRANIEYSGGRAQSSTLSDSTEIRGDLSRAFAAGLPAPGKPPLNPFGDPAEFAAALAQYRSAGGLSTTLSNHFSDATIRAAGSVLALPGGPLSLTLLAEQVRERVPQSSLKFITGNDSLSLAFPGFAQRTRSLYGEARLPITRDLGVIRDLELQFAVRQDWTRTALPRSGDAFSSPDGPTAKNYATTAYTAGLRFFPLPKLMVRGSIATGSLTPAVQQLGSIIATSSRFIFDPKRGGAFDPGAPQIGLLLGGSPNLKPEHARSISVGFVFTPGDKSGPRLSIDFTRIDKYHEVAPFLNRSLDQLLLEEDRFPGRVTRAPLTAQDIAQGFTGGLITRMDLTDGNFGRTRMDAVDVQADYPVSLGRLGDLRFYLNGSWEPHFRQRNRTAGGWIERVGFSDGPLKIRGNAGLDWSRGPISLGMNVQYYSHYKVIKATTLTELNAERRLFQGASHVPAQYYVDLHWSYRVSDEAKGILPPGMEFRAAVLNLFDHRPPTTADRQTPGYSTYGDARRRRFELTLAVPFRG